MHDLLPKLVTATTCLCGCTKSNASHLACDACFEKVPADLRDRFLTLARTKRGSCSYHVAVRDVERAVQANVDEAKKARGVAV